VRGIILLVIAPGISPQEVVCPLEEQLLRFHGKLHGKLFEHFAAKSAHDHRHGLLGAQPALLGVEDLIFTDL